MSDPRTTLETVIQTAIDSSLKELHTCLPAVVTRVDGQTIECQPTIKRKLKGNVVNLPLLVDVPLRYLKSAKYSIAFPISTGDHVLIIFAERSIDTWLLSGELQEPGDIRKHSLSDAFAIPMMYPETDLIPSFDSSDLVIKANNGTSKIIVSDSGTVSIETDGETKIESQSKVSMMAPSIELIATGSIKIQAPSISTIATTNMDMTAPTLTITAAAAVSLVSAAVSMTAPIISTIGIFTNVGILTATDFKTGTIDSINLHGHAPGTFADAESRPITGKSGIGS